MQAPSLTTRPIDKGVPIPYYYQIAQSLRAAISDVQVGAAEAEIAVPSEPELCRRFDVSRGVVRQALQHLEREGLVRRERGRGTFVTRRRLGQELTRLCSVTEDLRARGFTPGARLLGVRMVRPPLHIQHALCLREGGEVYEVYRLRLADEEPVSLQWCYTAVKLTPGLDQEDLTGSLWDLYTRRYGLVLAVADQTLRARAATPEEAELLDIDAGDPLVAITRTTYDGSETPVQYLDSLWRGDRYDFTVRLHSRDSLS